MPQKKNKDGYFRSTLVIGKKPDGKPERITIRAKTKREHDEKLAEAKRLHSKGVAQCDVTVREWSERWLSVYKANASPKQQYAYRSYAEKHILPSIGHLPIKNIRASHLQEMMNNHVGGKKGTVTKIMATIKQMFEAAEREGIIERNPSAYLTLPELTEALRRPLTDIERDVIWQVAQSHFAGTYVLTMLFCGLRRGECAGLKRKYVDFDNDRLLVREALRHSTNQGELKPPKSKAGIREVPIPDALRPYLEKQCEGKLPEDFLFTKVDGGRATDTMCRRWWQSFKRICHIKAGAKLYRNKILIETSPFGDELTPHYLRHNYATDLYAAGVDEQAQKYFLGHSPGNDVTSIYRKMNEDAFVRASNLMNTYMNNKYHVPKM